jgi:hypothetical protein
MEHEQVVVGEFGNEIDAEIAKGHLGSSGIKAFIIKDDVGGAFPSLQNAEGVRLSVAETSQARARIVLREKRI